MSSRLLILVVAACAAVGLFVALVARFWFVCDDAYIAFTYADHLAAGHGLVFFPGAEPVEGFSDPLWVLLLAGARAAGLDPVQVAPWLSALCGLALLLWVAALLLRRAGPVAAVAALMLLGSAPTMGLWSTSGLETMPAALATFAVFAALLGEPARPRPALAGVFAAALALLRPEGLALVLVWFALAAVCWRRRGQPSALGRGALAVAAAALLAAAAWVAFRLVYFGDWLPNTAYAKGGFHAFRLPRGGNYVASFLLTFPGLLVALALGRVAWRSRDTRDLCTAAAVLGAAVLGYTIYVGGDFMPMGRFLLPTLPFLAIVFGLAVQQLYDHDRLVPAAAAALAVVALDLPVAFDAPVVPAAVREAFWFRGPLPRQYDDFAVWQQMREGVRNDEQLAAALDAHTRPGETLIRAAIGVLGYRSRLHVIDSFALTTRRDPADYVVVAGGTPGHDRYLPWTVLLDDRPTYIHAHFARPGEPIVYGMMAGAFDNSPLADLVEVLRYPAAADAGGPRELRLLRFVRWDPPTDAMAALLDACVGVEPTMRDAELRLNSALPPGPRRAQQDARLRELLQQGRIAHHTAGPVRYSHAATPTPRTHGFAVDVTLQRGPAPPMALPRGKFVYAVPIEGDPELSGRRSGWLCVPPTSSHVDEVSGGTMLLIHVIPGGARGYGGGSPTHG